MTSQVFNHETFDLERIHYASKMASWQRRMEIAQSKRDQQLIALLEQERRQLEAAKPGVSWVSEAIAWVKNLWQQVTKAITDASTLQVWQSVDQQGNKWWFAYDPTTGHSTCTDSETEMRIWIEQNYQGQ